MRSEAAPVRDICADLIAISGGKNDPRRKRLRRLRPYIQKRFETYWLNRAALETIPRRTWNKVADDAMEHCYTGGTAARTTMLTALLEQIQPNPNLCPYCLLRQPTSLDHFLPKDHFPEFSVLAWNLVYVCDPCNRKKGNRFVGTPREVINPYFDTLPDTALLHADAELTGGGVRIRFCIDSADPAVPPATVALVRRHYQALALEKEYLREGAAVVADLVNAITSQYLAPIDQGQLDGAIDNRMREWGNYPVNSFRLAVIEALETCTGLLGYINGRIATVPRPPRGRPQRDLAALRAAAAARAAAL
jgi:5-methylcytosine-specific restriction endonuclease McrA